MTTTDIAALADDVMDYTSTYRGRWSGAEARPVLDALAAVDPAAQADLLMAIADRNTRVTGADQRNTTNRLLAVLVERLTAKATPDGAEVALRFAGRHSIGFRGNKLTEWTDTVLAAGRPLEPAVIAMLRRAAAAGYHYGAALGPLVDTLTEPPANPGEAWADQLNADVAAEPAWRPVIAHAATATSAKPPAKWDARAVALLAGVAEPGERLRGWLALVGRPRTIRLLRTEYEHDVNEAYDPVNATLLRGLLWLAVHLDPHPDTARVLGGVVETSLRKAAGLGPRSPKVANAAVYALSRLRTDAALGQIARLAARVTYKGTLKELNTALDARATELNLSRDEVEELAVPTYGLTGVGIRVEAFGDATATLDAATGAVTWRTAAGKEVKSPPAPVRAGFAEELKEFKAAAKDVDKMLAAQAERLDRQFLADRGWRFAAWREHYLDHPLLGTLARRIIWLVDGVPAMFADGALRTIDGDPVDTGEAVRLWHPIGRDVAEVVAWRARLEVLQVTQPFKQAHREVYVLTAAEENTRIYSNRYAAHVLRQHQFHALAAARGWDNRLRLMVDDSYGPPTRRLPAWGLRAEFWVEGIGDDYRTDTTESGSYLRIATDQVRFYRAGAPVNEAHAAGGGYGQGWGGGQGPADPLPLVDIPALVLSEVLRDVDLFVGVASVGNDPTWVDGGPEGRFRDYWASYSFGELSGTAQTRRDLLERLVPRLAVADRAHLDGRFLVVRGDLRTYKIHLGSGNILMTPNDQYLCIVPSQATDRGTPVYLPFDGDRTLAVIISKALMLARDTEITDPTITRQLAR